MKNYSDDTFYVHDLQEILGCQEKLPLGARMVYNLYALEGLSHEQIAKYLDISIETSKAQLHTAKELIQELLYKKAVLEA